MDVVGGWLGQRKRETSDVPRPSSVEEHARAGRGMRLAQLTSLPKPPGVHTRWSRRFTSLFLHPRPTPDAMVRPNRRCLPTAAIADPKQRAAGQYWVTA